MSDTRNELIFDSTSPGAGVYRSARHMRLQLFGFDGRAAFSSGDTALYGASLLVDVVHG